MLDRPAGSVAVAAHRAPALTQRPGTGAVWCRTVPELVVLARTGRLRAIVLDHDLTGIGLDLVDALRSWCPVLVADGRPARPAWEGAGAAVIAAIPADAASFEDAVARAVASRAARPPASHPGATGRGVLVTVVEAAGGGGGSAVAALARSLAATGPAPARVVLADLTLDGLHRPLHGLGTDHTGLPELIDASRFGPPTLGEVDAALHRIAPGLRLLPGLRHHHDWVSVGGHAAAVALESVRAAAEIVVVHVDRDLEGEADTGSFDIEDRNVLARTAVRSADLVVVSGRTGAAGHLGLLASLAAVAAYQVPHDRTLALATTSGRARRRSLRPEPLASGRLLHRTEDDPIDLRLGQAVRARIAAIDRPDVLAAASPAVEPQRVVPGALGHWAHDIEGWITPRVPQQP